MSHLVVWVDRGCAKVFHFSESATEPCDRQVTRFAEADSSSLFTQLSWALKPASRILILGPGVAKYHFWTFLSEHFPALRKKVIACEALDIPEDTEVGRVALHHFRGRKKRRA